MEQKRKRHAQVCHVRIFHPNNNKAVLKDIRMHGCPTWNSPEPKKKRPSYNWKIAAATTPHSVFILRRLSNTYETDCQTACQATSKTPFQIVALIENLFPQHISFII